jgi:K+-sensing histidine kinase KdpD
LIENAIRHATPGTTVVVRIRLDEELHAEVDNTGDGINESIRDQLFEPWVSGSENRSGLGLWLARESARSARGDVVCLAPTVSSPAFRYGCPTPRSPERTQGLAPRPPVTALEEPARCRPATSDRAPGRARPLP